MNFPQAARAQFVRCFDYSGRSSRSEYWYAALFNFLASIACSIVDTATGYPVLAPLFNLIVFPIGLSLQVRRLHDIDRSGWWILSPVVPALLTVVAILLGGRDLASIVAVVTVLAGFGLVITLLVWLCRAGSPGANRFGPNPLARYALAL